MDYKILGKDLKVSAVGLGCMGMSHAYGSPADKNEMCELITKAVDLGYNFFDTAEIYGTANNPPFTALIITCLFLIWQKKRKLTKIQMFKLHI